jgi:hypothetical protein
MNNIVDKETKNIYSDILHFNDIHKNVNDDLLQKKKKLIDISKNLSNLEYFEILNIIKEDKCSFTENANGIFINLINVNENTINKIFYFLDFIKHKKEDLIKHEEILDNAKKNIGTINKEQENEIKNNRCTLEYNEYDSLSESDTEKEKNNKYLSFSSDEDDDLENKLSLKKKKTKYSGKKAKIIKSIKDSNDNCKTKNKPKINLK